MPCCLALIALSAPRFVLFLLWVFSDYVGRAFETLWVPLLGFFLLPTTTLSYAWAMNSRGEVKGLHLAVLILAVMLDLGTYERSNRSKRKRSE